jgi:ABC-type multidrug transport system ATPase subunit
LDGEALHDVCAALRPLLAQSTAFIVAHDCETMQLAKRVLFLENGRLAGDGTHDELFARNARYRALWDEQSGQPRIAPSDATREVAIHSPATPAPTSLADQEQRERADGSGAMVPSLERPRAGTADAGYPIEIELANGRRIRVYATADMTALLRIVEALESRRV